MSGIDKNALDRHITGNYGEDFFAGDDLLTVTVVDRKAMNEKYGSPSFRGVELRTVEILPVCPICGELRGDIGSGRFHEWGEFYEVSVWTNPCGHTDSYSDVLREARMIQDGEL